MVLYTKYESPYWRHAPPHPKALLNLRNHILKRKTNFIEVSNQICGIPKQPDSQWAYYVAPSKDKFTF